MAGMDLHAEVAAKGWGRGGVGWRGEVLPVCEQLRQPLSAVIEKQRGGARPGRVPGWLRYASVEDMGGYS